VTDIFTPAKRSLVMAATASSGNKSTEMRLIAVFRLYGITGWRRHVRLHGKPDFVFPRERVAVFVDGCFWHGCPRHASMPTSRASWWATKLAANRTRDRIVTRTLRATGWRVLRIWECALVKKRTPRTVGRILRVSAVPKQNDNSFSSFSGAR
jgi:DNA mismatch endonuclease, patch repair protein